MTAGWTLAAAQAGQRLPAVGAAFNGESFLLQHLGQSRANVVVVVDNQDGAGAHRPRFVQLFLWAGNLSREGDTG